MLEEWIVTVVDGRIWAGLTLKKWWGGMFVMDWWIGEGLVKDWPWIVGLFMDCVKDFQIGQRSVHW